MSDIGFALNYMNLYLIDITPNGDAPTWARLGQGIKTVEPDDSDETSEEYYYDGEGDAETDVTGGSRGYKVEGDRYHGNAAQDYIAGLRFEKGEARVTQMKHIGPDGRSIVGKVSITDIVDGGGDANEKGGFECSLKFKGKPSIEAAKTDQMPSAVTAEPVTVGIGKTAQISPQVTPQGASDAMAYASSDVTVATVDDSGVVKGVKEGTCKVSLKSIVAPSVSCVVEITVTDTPEG